MGFLVWGGQCAFWMQHCQDEVHRFITKKIIQKFEVEEMLNMSADYSFCLVAYKLLAFSYV